MDENLLNLRKNSPSFKKLNALKQNYGTQRNYNNNGNNGNSAEILSLKQQMKINEDVFASRKNSGFSIIKKQKKLLDIKPNATPNPYITDIHNYCTARNRTISNNKKKDSKSCDYNNDNSDNYQENNFDYYSSRKNYQNPIQNFKSKIISSNKNRINNNGQYFSGIINHYINNLSDEKNNKDINIYNNINGDLFYNLNQNKNRSLITEPMDTSDIKLRKRSQKIAKINFGDILDNAKKDVSTYKKIDSQIRAERYRNTIKEQINENKVLKYINNQLCNKLNLNKKKESEKLQNFKNENNDLKKQILNLTNNLDMLKKQCEYFKNQFETSKQNNTRNNKITYQLQTENNQLKSIKAKYDSILTEYLLQVKKIEMLIGENTKIKNNGVVLEAKIKNLMNSNLKLSKQLNELVNCNQALLNKNEELLKNKRLNKKANNNLMNIQNQQNFFFNAYINKDKNCTEDINKNNQSLNIIQRIKTNEISKTGNVEFIPNKNVNQYLINHFELFYNNSTIIKKKEENNDSNMKLQIDYKDLKIEYDDLNNKYNEMSENNKLLTNTIKQIKKINHPDGNDLIDQIIELKKQNDELLKYKEQNEYNKINEYQNDDNKKKIKKKIKIENKYKR